MIHMGRKVKVLIVSSCDSLASLLCASVFSNPNIQVVCVAKTRLPFIQKLRLLNRAMKLGSIKYAIYIQCEIFIAYVRRLRNKVGKNAISYSIECNVPVLVVESLSGNTMAPLVKTFKPNVILSIRPGLIFKRNAIEAMPVIINVHCSRLPSHAGIGGVLQALAAGDKVLGVTFHFVDSEEIDSGPIIMQDTVPVEKGRSVFHHTYSLYKKAGAMIDSWEPNYRDGNLVFYNIDADKSLVPSYNSWPKKCVYKNLAKNGYGLISFEDFLGC